MWVAVLAAMASALGFAISSSLQHHAAGAVPTFRPGKPLHFLWHLTLQPLWLIGQVLAACSFVLHAWALHIGALAVVQPIVVSGMVFAVPLRAALMHRMPSARELRAVTLTAVGLAVFLIASNPAVGDGEVKQGVVAAITLAGIVFAAVCVFVASRTHVPRHRAFFMGVTAGTLFGVVAGLVKLSIGEFTDDGLSGMATSWSTWTLLLLGAWGVSTNLRAYQVADLSASLPALSIVNVGGALVMGRAAFHEIPAHTPLALVVEAGALATIIIGLRTLAQLSDLAEHENDPEPAQSADRSLIPDA
jgi:drug/metabolite transporter (DMT)-like permease